MKSLEVTAERCNEFPLTESEHIITFHSTDYYFLLIRPQKQKSDSPHDLCQSTYKFKDNKEKGTAITVQLILKYFLTLTHSLVRWQLQIIFM